MGGVDMAAIDTMQEQNISTLIGKTLTLCIGRVGGQAIVFITTEGQYYALYHEQECCEEVVINDICGDLLDLVGSPIVQAEEINHGMGVGAPESQEEKAAHPMWAFSYATWTFYRLATEKGQVVVRWFGTSNGYYSERAEFSECSNRIKDMIELAR